MSRFYSRLPTATYYAVRSWAGNFTGQIRLSRLQTRSKIAKTAAHEGRAARSISSVLRLIYNIKLTVILVNCKNCPIGCPYNLFLRFPPLGFGAGFSSLAFSVAPFLPFLTCSDIYISRRLTIFKRCFTRIFCVQVYARLQSFVYLDKVMPYWTRSPREFRGNWTSEVNYTVNLCAVCIQEELIKKLRRELLTWNPAV